MLADPLIRVQMLQCIAGRSTIYSMLQIVVLEGKKRTRAYAKSKPTSLLCSEFESFKILSTINR